MMNRKKSTSSTPTQHSVPFPYPLSRQRTPSYPNSAAYPAEVNESQEKDLTYLAKRSAHNALERQRREGLNSKFQELAHVLPALQQVKRPSKSMIVAKSLEFVSTAEQRELEYKDQLSALRQENERLLRQANGKKNESRTRNSSKKRQLSNSPNHKKIKSADSLEENPRKKKKKERKKKRAFNCL